MKHLIKVCLLIGCFIFISFSFYAFSQNKYDSLVVQFSKPHHDTIKFEFLLSIGDIFEYEVPDKAKEYYTQAKELAELNMQKTNNKKLLRKFTQQKAKAIRYIAYVYFNQGDNQTALDYYYQALRIGEEIDCHLNIYNSYNNIAIINHVQNEYETALEFYNKAIEITEKTGNKIGRAKLFINTGILNFDLAMKAETQEEKNSFFQAALEDYSTALEMKIEQNDTKGQSLVYNNLGNIKKEQAKIAGNEKIKIDILKESSLNYWQSVQLSNSINDKMGLSRAYANLSELYSIIYSLGTVNNDVKRNYVDSTMHFGTLSYSLAKELNSLYYMNIAALILKNAYTTLGNYSKALEFADIYIRTQKEMFSEEKTKALKEMQAKYETEKKEKQIEVQKFTIQKAQSRLLIVFLIASMLLLASLSLVYVIRLKTQTEKLLAKKNDELKASNATKDKFFSIISHDLRTPVSGFRNLSSAIGINVEHLSSEQIKENLYNLSQSADETVNMLNNLLHWAKSQQNKIEVIPFPVSIARMCKKLIEELGPKLIEKSITIDIDVDENTEAEFDQNIVSTVLRNLLTNAIKFSPSRSTIHLGTLESDNCFTFSVRDQGIGLTQEDLSKLFRIEFDTKSIGSSPEKGSGLGLIICSELVTLHGGKIWVESEPNQGSTFFFTIPKE